MEQQPPLATVRTLGDSAAFTHGLTALRITITCPICSAAIRAPAAAAGRRAKCPKCGERIQIPAREVAEPSPTLATAAVTAPASKSDRGHWIVLVSVGAFVLVLVGIGVLWAVGWRPRLTAPPVAQTVQSSPAKPAPAKPLPVKTEPDPAAIEAQRRERSAAEETKRREEDAAELAKRIAARSNTKEVAVKDLMNVPESYIGRSCRLENVWVHGNLYRSRDFKLFGVGLSTQDGKYTTGVIGWGDGIHFAVSEDFGRKLDIFLSAESNFKARVFCDVVERSASYHKNAKIGIIYRIEFFNRGGGLHTIYEDGKEPVTIAQPQGFEKPRLP
jgi:hypothetical protein